MPQVFVDQIEENVTSIMAVKEKKHSADTLKEETTIDLIVYHLYGLTYDEVKIVDPEISITKEEYEKNY